MRIVEKLCDREGHKMHFFLSKADTVPDETDRQRVLVQYVSVIAATFNI
jgi:hypothetical protein